MVGEPEGTAAGMTDVAAGSYYEKAVAWAIENGITTGTADGRFAPDATCPRAQGMTFLFRASKASADGALPSATWPPTPTTPKR